MKRAFTCSICGYEPIVDMFGCLNVAPLIVCERGSLRQRRHISHARRKK